MEDCKLIYEIWQSDVVDTLYTYRGYTIVLSGYHEDDYTSMHTYVCPIKEGTENEPDLGHKLFELREFSTKKAMDFIDQMLDGEGN